MDFTYKSFCWSFGTTSFRTQNFNKTIEQQLSLLREFWNIPTNKGANWIGNNTLQEAYYNFMKSKKFVDGDANNKPKDAREKTSGLVDIGIIDEGRNITNAGLKLLEMCDNNDFKDENLFEIDKDSFFYLRQLLKVSYNIDGKIVRPFIVFAYCLVNLDFLSLTEFTYLLPLCVDDSSTKFIVEKIKLYRENKITIDEVIIDTLMNMQNYREAYDYFNSETTSEKVICDVGMNRKSRDYDKPYFNLYKELNNVYLKKDKKSIYNLYLATKKINIGKWWRSYLFDTSASKSIQNNPTIHLKKTVFDSIVDENGLKDLFFKRMHLYKARATLSDYQDLNKRYIKTADVILFEDSTVKFDIMPKAYFEGVINDIYADAYSSNAKLYDETNLEEIKTELKIPEAKLLKEISTDLGVSISSISEAKTVIEDKRYSRLEALIDSKFSNEQIIYLLECFENRKDNEIQELVTDNADVPTIFEYVLGIAWYKISERKGKLLSYLKLSLDANLLPKTHAGGGEADIVYEYDRTDIYPAHSLLLEATLADSTNQRRMEMEPVSRHLGQHLLKTGNLLSYCVFITNYLNINVVSDFRSRKQMLYYDSSDYSKYVEGMKIIPVESSVLKTILIKHLTYSDIYLVFENAFQSGNPPHEWYDSMIVSKL